MSKKRILLNEFKHKYECKVKLSDIINKTDFFKNKKERNKKNFWKYFFSIITILAVIGILLVTTVKVISIINDYRYESASIEDSLLTTEDVEIALKECDVINDSPLYTVNLGNNSQLYIFRFTDITEQKIVYFYKLLFGDNVNEQYTLIVDNKSFLITKDSTFSSFATFNTGDVEKLDFSITYKGKTKKFYFEG